MDEAQNASQGYRYILLPVVIIIISWLFMWRPG